MRVKGFVNFVTFIYDFSRNTVFQNTIIPMFLFKYLIEEVSINERIVNPMAVVVGFSSHY